MAEGIGITSGILTITSFSFQAGLSLHQAIKSFQNNKKEIRELKEELQSFNNVLGSLQELVSEKPSQFKILCLPLLHCAQACTGFEEVITDCTKHSNETKTSFRDWARLQYAGSDISGFKNMLSDYKATISIAIGDANLRASAVNANALSEFKDLLEYTTTDLKDRLENLADKLKSLDIQKHLGDEDISPFRESIQTEIDSTGDCLGVCRQAADHVNQLRMNVFEDITAGEEATQHIVATLGDLISAKRVSAAPRATQLLGQMSDETVQAVARSRGIDLTRTSIHTVAREKVKESIAFQDHLVFEHTQGQTTLYE